LERTGNKVIIVNNGKEALVALKYKQFDLILMDIQMPVMDGLKATECIRDLEKSTGEHMPIIAMTANAMKGDRERYLMAGMDDYVSKPIDPEELFSAINRITGKEKLSSQDQKKIPIDLNSALNKLDGDKNLLLELVKIIESEYKPALQDLKNSIDVKDFEKVREMSHYLKTSLGSINAKSGYNLAYDLEMKSKNKDLSSADEILNKLEYEIENVINLFNNSNWEEYL
jgi:two-component system, sensor histidine kinase and response regulator